ncbi:MAG: T9SS type A sorting domain-containing protein [Crocinitomicaceae bacterium]|nr:T9SS type A sorting domain-containing protein [Crocinitomicaceae bacterium]
MKQTYFLLIAMFFSGFVFGQVEFHLDSDPQISQNGQTINLDVDYYGYTLYMHCLNTSGVTQGYKFRRVIESQSATFTDQFCDDNLCYSCSGTDWVSPAPVTVVAGDSTLFKPIYNFTDGGTATIKYYALDVNNGDQIIDSVTIQINSSVGIEEVDVSFTAYPNPVADNFFINFNGNEGLTFNLVIYNLVGEEVLKSTLTNGTNKLSLASLNNGVYFYSIVTNDDIIETKKIIVRH